MDMGIIKATDIVACMTGRRSHGEAAGRMPGILVA